MAKISQELQSHLETGLTTLCHAWLIRRKDGREFAFTDHDVSLTVDGRVFRADAGLSAKALTQTTGLSVDNTEAVGALSHASIREDEIEQGRFDGAEVLAWRVNWTDTQQYWLQFRGTIGELHRADGAFRAELRGLTEALNNPVGRVYQKPCTAVLGDKACGFNLNDPDYAHVLPIEDIKDGRVFQWEDLSDFASGWFARGRIEIVEGEGAGLWGMIKEDRFDGSTRVIELWEPIRARLTPGTKVRLIAGCDKRMETCRLKFNNLINFQGFPDIPGEDWVTSVPRSGGANTGGSLR